LHTSSETKVGQRQSRNGVDGLFRRPNPPRKSCFLPTTSKLPIFTGHLGKVHFWYIISLFFLFFAHSKLDVSPQDEDDDLYSDDLRPGQAKGAKAASSAIV